MNPPKIAALFLVSIFVTGCYSLPTINEYPTHGDSLKIQNAQTPHTSFPAYLVDYRRVYNGVDVNNMDLAYDKKKAMDLKAISDLSDILKRTDGLRAEKIKNVINSLRKINIFSSIKDDGEKPSETKYFKLSLGLSDNENKHESTNAAKQAAWVLSATLLMPFLPNDYDYEQELMLDVVRWDGKVKHYSARTTGTTKYTQRLLYSVTDENKAYDELIQMVSDSNLNSLANQLVQDAAFFQNDSK